MAEDESTRTLLHILRTTDDGSARNQAAIALSDRRIPELFDEVVLLLSDERTRHRRGTLLYVLAAYDCSSILPLLIEIVIDGDFEERSHAIELIDGIATTLDLETWRRCATRLESAVAVAGPEARPGLQELLALFR
jgi:HEAT repeat protein